MEASVKRRGTPGGERCSGREWGSERRKGQFPRIKPKRLGLPPLSLSSPSIPKPHPHSSPPGHSHLRRICRFKAPGLSLQKDTPSYPLLNPALGLSFPRSASNFFPSASWKPPFGLFSGVLIHPSLSAAWFPVRGQHQVPAPLSFPYKQHRLPWSAFLMAFLMAYYW